MLISVISMHVLHKSLIKEKAEGKGRKERSSIEFTESRFFKGSVLLLGVAEAFVRERLGVLVILETFEVIGLQMTVPSWLLSIDKSSNLSFK